MVMNIINISLFPSHDKLRHIFFEQVQGTVPFDREIKEYIPVKDNWFLSMDAIRSFILRRSPLTTRIIPLLRNMAVITLFPF